MTQKLEYHNAIIYNIQEIIKARNLGKSYEYIMNDVPNCVSRKCSVITIYRILKLIENEDVDLKGIGELKDIRNSRQDSKKK